MASRFVGGLLVASSLLAGCSVLTWHRKPPAEATVNWYCVPGPENQGQICQRRRLRDGQPVDDEIFETLTIPGKEAPLPVAAKARLPDEAVPWDRKPVTAINPIDDSASLSVENIGPSPRQTKDTVDMWAAHRKEGAKAAPKASSDIAVKSSVPAEVAASAEGSLPAEGSLSAKGSLSAEGSSPASLSSGPRGYTVQLGAFASSEQSEHFIRSQKLERDGLYTRKIRTNNTEWWILTQGAYTSKEEAVAAFRAFSKRFPDKKLWVRSWSSIEARRVP